MELTLKLVSILLSGGILYVGYVARKVSGTWLTPACIWCVGWFFLTFIPLLVAFSVPVNPLAILYILVMSVVFSIPVFGTKWKNIKVATHAEDSSPFDSALLRVSFYIFACVSAVALTVHLSIQGVTLSALSTNFFETSSALIVDRYTESTVENIFAQISNISTYVTVGLGGLVFPGYRTLLGKLRILSLAMAPSLALMTIAGAKGTIFLCIAIFYGGYLVRRLRAGDNRLIDIATISRASLGFAVLLPFVTISFMSRGLYEDAAMVELSSSLYRNFVSYSSAHIYAFSDWFSWYIGFDSHVFYASDEMTGGFFTFMSLFKALGSTKVVPPGYYDEYFQYSWFLQTNIYTIFRGLITDFSLAGSVVFMYLAGFASNLIFVSLMRNGRASWSVAFYVVFCGFVYTSFLISILVWSSMYPTFGIIGVLLLVNNERFARRANRQSTPAVATS
ncbi:O-antigen polymerase [Sphingomonas sp. HF-S4]|uniref:O-antigen polymerase n=1 Tax=Sphingomonas agrestis TaxID=3080540 RepID=A0ABU3YAN5_9SPHN|nr:O-antigen polymerase [Sphingomonas sp. HF-S4]MDV3458440.1 O-antigen polymerase [Sphingomonas sp. HF-S4]